MKSPSPPGVRPEFLLGEILNKVSDHAEGRFEPRLVLPERREKRIGVSGRTGGLRRHVRESPGAEPIRQSKNVLGGYAAAMQQNRDETRVLRRWSPTAAQAGRREDR